MQNQYRKIRPLISFIILQHYTQDHLLLRCLNSVACQSSDDFECVVVSDTPCGIIPANPHIRWFDVEPQTPGSGRNIGIRNAYGEYIVFIDSDDFVELTFVEHFAKIVNSYDHPEAILFGHSTGLQSCDNPHINPSKNCVTLDSNGAKKFALSLVGLSQTDALNGIDPGVCWGKGFKNLGERTPLFPAPFMLGEDVSFCLRYFYEKTDKLVLVHDWRPYHHIANTTSVTATSTTSKVDVLNGFAVETLGFFEQHKENDPDILLAKRHFGSLLLDTFLLMCQERKHHSWEYADRLAAIHRYFPRKAAIRKIVWTSKLGFKKRLFSALLQIRAERLAALFI